MEERNNRVYICGTLEHKYRPNEKCVIVNIRTAGSFPQVVAFDEKAEILWRGFDEGMTISIGGYVVSSKRRCTGITQSIFVDDIYSINPNATDQRNEFYLQGIVKVRKNCKKYTYIELIVCDCGHLAYIPVIVKGAVAEDIRRGSSVKVTGSVVTRRKGERYFQDFFAGQIVVCENENSLIEESQ